MKTFTAANPTIIIISILCPLKYCWFAVISVLWLNRPVHTLNTVAPIAPPRFLDVDIMPDATPPELLGTLPITILVIGA